MKKEEIAERDEYIAEAIGTDVPPMNQWKRMAMEYGWAGCAAYRESKLTDIGEFDEDAARAEYDRLDDETDQYAEDFLDAYTWMKAAAWQHSQDKAALAKLKEQLGAARIFHLDIINSKDKELKEAQEKIAELEIETKREEAYNENKYKVLDELIDSLRREIEALRSGSISAYRFISQSLTDTAKKDLGISIDKANKIRAERGEGKCP